MSFWELENIKSAIGGSWLARSDPNQRATPTGVSIDSRTLLNGQAFIAIRGDRTDGHEYLAAAAKGGASLLIVDRADAVTPLLPTLHRSVSVLLVSDTGKALLQLAGAYRKTLESTRVIAVGGSNGKTTTTRLIDAILSSTLRGTASKKSFNNAVGVPLTILAAKRTDQFLICEVGTNAPGEIAVLSAVLQPDIAVITSIGREHLEGLVTIEGVVAEEARLLDDLRPKGIAIITADSPQLTQRIPSAPGQGRSVLRFGVAPDADLRITSVQLSPAGTHFEINGRSSYSVPLLGAHNANNAAAAIAVARRFGLADDTIRAALASARGPDMRLEPVQKEGVHFLNDAYNANPDSMLAALDVYAACTPNSRSQRHGRSVLVLGEMLELGDSSIEAHREIGRAVATMVERGHTLDLVVFVGGLAKSMHDAANSALHSFTGVAPTLVHFAESSDSSRREIARLLRPGDFVLLKGSRRVALEGVIEQVSPTTVAQGPSKPTRHGISAA